MYNSVRSYALSCFHCQGFKHSTGAPAGMQTPVVPPTRPFEVIGIDHLGPFKTTRSGKKHIIVAIDYLSKWVEANAVPNTTTSHALTFIRHRLINRHGFPTRIITDQGTAFTSHEFEGQLELWNIKHTLCVVEHPDGEWPRRAHEQNANVLSSSIPEQVGERLGCEAVRRHIRH